MKLWNFSYLKCDQDQLIISEHKPNIANMSLNSPSLESEPPPPPPTLDSVLGKLGNPGKYQVCIYKEMKKREDWCKGSFKWAILWWLLLQVVLMLLLATNYIPVVVNHLLMAFYSAKVPFHCKVGCVTSVTSSVITDIKQTRTINIVWGWSCNYQSLLSTVSM